MFCTQAPVYIEGDPLRERELMSFCYGDGAVKHVHPARRVLLSAGIRSVLTQFLWELFQLNKPAENEVKTLSSFCRISKLNELSAGPGGEGDRSPSGSSCVPI